MFGIKYSFFKMHLVYFKPFLSELRPSNMMQQINECKTKHRKQYCHECRSHECKYDSL